MSKKVEVDLIPETEFGAIIEILSNQVDQSARLSAAEARIEVLSRRVNDLEKRQK